MSEGPAQETRPPRRMSPVDIAGGPVVLAVLGLFLVAVAVLDLYALPVFVMNGSSVRVFVDPCSGEPYGDAGGFAVLLLLLSALVVLGLHLFWRTTVIASVTLFLVALAVQYWIGRSFSLYSAWNSLEPLYVAWNARYPWICPSGPSANSVALWQYWHALYNPSIEQISPPSLYPGDVSRQFTDMLAANLLLLAVFAAVIWAAGLLRAVVAWIMRLAGRSPTRRAAPLSRLNLPQRTVLFQLVVVTLGFIMFGPALLLIADPDSPSNMTRSVEDFIWAGSLVLLLDAARLALNLEPADAPLPVTEQDGPDTGGELFLGAVYKALLKDFPSAVHASFVRNREGSMAGRAGFPELDTLSEGQGITFLGGLSEHSYAQIAEIINRRVLDRGRTALVICPDEGLDALEHALVAALEPPHSGLGMTPWRIGRPVPKEGTIDLILASPVTLETLINTAPRHERDLARLGGLIIVNLHRIDLGLLHIGLTRLLPHVANRARLIGVVQTEYRADIRDWASNIPPLKGFDFKVVNASGPVADCKEHVILFERDASEGFDALEHLPIGYRALMRVGEKDARSVPFVFDIAAEAASKTWEMHVDKLLMNQDGALAEWCRDITFPVLAPREAEHPVAVLEDRRNLADTLGSAIATGAARETLAIVSLGTEPGSGFQADALRDAQADVRDERVLKDRLDAFGRRFASIAPKPKGSPMELALTIRQEFAAEAAERSRMGIANAGQGTIGRLRQDRIDHLFVLSGTAMRQLRISNTRGGLQRLFGSTFRLPRGQSVVDIEPFDQNQDSAGRSRIKNFVLSGQPADSAEAIATLTLVTREGENPVRLPLADHGLGYAEQVRLPIEGKIWKVEKVDERERVVRVEVDEEKPLHPYSFVRDYAVNVGTGEETVFAAESFDERVHRVQPYQIATGYAEVARTTRAFYEYAGPSRPFSETREPKATNCLIRSGLMLRSTSILRLIPRSEEFDQSHEPGRRGRRFRLGRTTSRGRANQNLSINPETALTLAATLQDTLAMMFPEHARRIAVLNPDLLQCRWTHAGAVTRFLFDRHPQLVPLNDRFEPATRPPEGAYPAWNGLAEGHADFVRRFVAQGRRTLRDDDTVGDALTSFMIVEDSDHDLGVAKAFAENEERILKTWMDFVEHCADNAKGNPHRTGYDFGSGRVPDVLDFQSAAGVLRAMHDTVS